VLAFANDRNLRLIIRNTGHDYYGKSTGAGGLAVWTHFLKSFEVLSYRSSYYTGEAVKLGAGMQSEEATEMAYHHGLTIVGGECPTVGLVGGYTQGGGHGPLTSKYGFGADQVLEWQVVKADGDVLIATPVENADLYWALSGGGGGTFGIVLSMTVKAYTNEPTAAANLTFLYSNQRSQVDSFYEAVGVFLDCLAALSDAGAAAVWYVDSTGFSLVPATGPGMKQSAMNHILKPVIKKLEDLSIPYGESSIGPRKQQRRLTSEEYSSAEFPSYYESYKAFDPPSLTDYAQIGSRLIPRSVVTEKTDELIQAIRDIIGYGAGVSGTAFKAPQKSGFSNSVNPEFRNSLISLTVGT
jgi:hypothetical protein